jgi:hypothetical protein
MGPGGAVSEVDDPFGGVLPVIRHLLTGLSAITAGTGSSAVVIRSKWASLQVERDNG